MDAATFDKLFQATSQVPAISSARMTKDSPDVDTETHHIIMATEGKKGDTYAVSEKDAPPEFREWLDLLLSSIPNA